MYTAARHVDLHVELDLLLAGVLREEVTRDGWWLLLRGRHRQQPLQPRCADEQPRSAVSPSPDKVLRVASVSRSFGTERHFRAVPRIYPALRAPVPASATSSSGTAVPSVSHFAGSPAPLSSAGGTVCIVGRWSHPCVLYREGREGM